MAMTGPVIAKQRREGTPHGTSAKDSAIGIWMQLGRLVRCFWLLKRGKSWVHLTRKYLQIEFSMTRHHNQCFVKLSQLTDNKQDPTHDHNTHSTYDANSTLPLYDALILRPHAWVGCYFDSALTLRWSSFSKHVDGTIHYLDISTNHLHVKQRTDVASGHIPNAFPSAAGA